MLTLAIPIALALVVGWVAGMVTHKRAERWCPLDGSTLTCPRCAKAGLHVLGTTARQSRRTS